MTQPEALQWIANLFEESVDNIQADTSRLDIPAWDSLGVLTLMADLSDRFDITLTNEELTSMKRVRDILAVLERHGQLQ
jgi:acyl carrier protein